MSSNNSNNIGQFFGAVAIVATVLGGAVALVPGPDEAVAVKTETPAAVTAEPPAKVRPIPSMAPEGLTVDVTDDEAQACFDSGGNYRFGNGCVPVRIR